MLTNKKGKKKRGEDSSAQSLKAHKPLSNTEIYGWPKKKSLVVTKQCVS